MKQQIGDGENSLTEESAADGKLRFDARTDVSWTMEGVAGGEKMRLDVVETWPSGELFNGHKAGSYDAVGSRTGNGMGFNTVRSN
ncbi:hypothetical protein GWI33_003094 [Rhynchophorus ferrugineus]|uniref:Uncharacterized protein n=1 Tax=Rhynchophorus ferrugineus TaxID=354439 RepID=A0A834IJU2_RHYFE|nr:hypothetical protein GWI33_003094 [Rhynchophorus ferrugineus]